MFYIVFLFQFIIFVFIKTNIYHGRYYLGFRIKQIREEKKLSQEQLVNFLVISQSKLSKIENGRLKKIDIKGLFKLSLFLNIEVAELINMFL